MIGNILLFALIILSIIIYKTFHGFVKYQLEDKVLAFMMAIFYTAIIPFALMWSARFLFSFNIDYWPAFGAIQALEAFAITVRREDILVNSKNTF